jgi:hypothetical protein
VSAAASGASGAAIPLDLATTQRALVDDVGPSGTNWHVGASFVESASTKNITFVATAMNGTLLDLLKNQLSPPESLLSGWGFSTTNYTVSPTNPVYLSFDVGPGHPSDELEIWRCDEANGWSRYDAFDLTYDGEFASFTATSFSGYAMVAVPEPTTLILCCIGATGVLTCTWKKRRHVASVLLSPVRAPA